jgi:hypothetical protein
MTQNLLAIDPGNTHSAYVVLSWFGTVLAKGKVPNEEMLTIIRDVTVDGPEHLAIEMVSSYGMAVGETVFETVLWTGRFIEAFEHGHGKDTWTKVKRMEVKMNLCHNSRAKDANIRQALIDRFGEPGTKKNPGPTYGFAADMWAALAVGVTWQDKQKRWGEDAPPLKG